jgi:hypothetical protein
MSRSKRKGAPRAAGPAAVPESRFAKGFSEIESSLRDLPRIARLAEEQLHRAIGGLAFNGSEYTEIPHYAEAELAIFAVSQVAQMTKDFEGLYDRIYSEAAEAHTA